MNVGFHRFPVCCTAERLNCGSMWNGLQRTAVRELSLRQSCCDRISLGVHVRSSWVAQSRTSNIAPISGRLNPQSNRYKTAAGTTGFPCTADYGCMSVFRVTNPSASLAHFGQKLRLASVFGNSFFAPARIRQGFAPNVSVAGAALGILPAVAVWRAASFNAVWGARSI